MPTPDESNVNPVADLLESEEDTRLRLEREQKMHDFLKTLPTKESVQEKITAARQQVEKGGV